MSEHSSAPRPFRLKATAGPLKGARFPLTETVTIGRSSQVEIFVADAGVSRRHAKVFPLPDGGHVLIDLGSANGTLIEGEPISEHRLEPGQSFTVGGTTFQYEEAIATEPVAPDRGVYAVRADEGSSVERTVVTLGADDETTRKPATAKKPTARPPSTPADRGSSWQRIEARDRDGNVYAGDLISDVILFRNLRLRFVRGDSMPPAVRTSYESLENRLRALDREDPDSREFERYQVAFPAHLRFSRSEDVGVPVEVRDFGVGGARVHCPSLLLDLDELTWLAVDLVGQQGPRTIVFTARVVWMQNDDMGLVFSGAPGWLRHNRDNEAEDTLVMGRRSRARTRPVKLRLAPNGTHTDD